LRSGISNQAASLEFSNQAEHAEAAAYLRGVSDILAELPVAEIEIVIDRLFSAYQQGRTVYLFGNGGSAALASHAACDLGKGTMVAGKRPFRVVSLCDNIPLMTAWANDSSYDDIFSAQLRPLLEPRDIAFAISGSGNSPNVLNALRHSKELGGVNLGLTGCGGGKMKPLCDTCIIVPSGQMQQIEDSHVCAMHAVFFGFRRRLQNENRSRAASAGNYGIPTRDL
jgi:D-sedoheptulose 7-phosphate isomerase